MISYIEKTVDESVIEETIEGTSLFFKQLIASAKDPNTYVMLINMLIKIFLIIFLSRCILFVVRKFLERTERKHPDSRRHKTIGAVFGSAFKVVVNFFMLTGILDALGVPTTAVVAFAGVGSVAVGFGAQSLVSDVITGLFSVAEDYYGVDDVIRVKDATGKVESVGIRSITIRSANGDLHIIPHGQIQMVTNFTREFKRAVIDLDLPYDTDPEYIIEALKAEFAKYDGGDRVIGEPSVSGVINFGESGFVVRIACDCKIGEHWSVERDFRIIILKFLKREGVEIPFTTRAIVVTHEEK